MDLVLLLMVSFFRMVVFDELIAYEEADWSSETFFNGTVAL